VHLIIFKTSLFRSRTSLITRVPSFGFKDGAFLARIISFSLYSRALVAYQGDIPWERWSTT